MIIDEKRLERQKDVVIKWIKNGYVGTFIGVTGVGKSYIAILSIIYILKKRPNAKILVVVPTINLKDQWLNLLSNNELPQVKVIVLNTASKSNIECDYLIVDELHTAGSNFFINLFDCIKYKAFLGLTATIERSDGRHSILLEKAPIIDEIGLEEALREGYISDYQIFNIPVTLTKNEIENINKAQKTYTYYESLLGGSFSAWKNANNILRDKNNEFTQEQRKNALIFLKKVNDRKTLLYNVKSKIKLTKEILDKFPNRKAIIFCGSINFAKNLHKYLNDISVLYHSGLTAKEKKLALKTFKKILISCKALDAGTDIDGLNLGICCAGSGKSLQSIQRLGRSVRLNKNNTLALYFNIYVKDSQEEKWLKSRCYNIPNVKWIENLNEINYVS